MYNQNLFSTQKKSFFKRKAFYFILAGILVFGYFIGQIPEGADSPDEIQTDVTQPVKTNDKPQKDRPVPGVADSSDLPEKDDVIASDNEYYLVKEVDGVVKVFYYDQTGTERLVKNMDIAFSLISESDQALFSEGIILESEEELLDLLQDFES